MPENGIIRRVTDEEAARLAPEVARLLRVVPETWSTFDMVAMTAAQERALWLLTAAEMVERRLRFRVSMATAPTSLEAVLTATGERGFAEAMEPLLGKAWSLWEERYRVWNAGDARETTPFIVESVPPHEWRLTESGVLARNDSDAGDTGGIDFVLGRGCFDGRPRRTPDGRVFARPEVVRGSGRVESLIEHGNGTELPRVNVANWSDGAEVLSGHILAAVGEVLAEHFKGKASLPRVDGDARHSEDFTYVYWFGTEHRFALGVQSAAVRALWEEWERTGLGLHQQTIRNRTDAERDNFKMPHVFRDHSAWGTMIVADGDGRYRLKQPVTSA